MASPCGEGYSLIGDICMPTPEGYVETRNECEMGVDSMEAAGVEQNYAAEIAKCRENQTDVATGVAGMQTETLTLEVWFSSMVSGIAEWFADVLQLLV